MIMKNISSDWRNKSLHLHRSWTSYSDAKLLKSANKSKFVDNTNLKNVQLLRFFRRLLKTVKKSFKKLLLTRTKSRRRSDEVLLKNEKNSLANKLNFIDISILNKCKHWRFPFQTEKWFARSNDNKFQTF